MGGKRQREGKQCKNKGYMKKIAALRILLLGELQ